MESGPCWGVPVGRSAAAQRFPRFWLSSFLPDRNSRPHVIAYNIPLRSRNKKAFCGPIAIFWMRRARGAADPHGTSRSCWFYATTPGYRSNEFSVLYCVEATIAFRIIFMAEASSDFPPHVLREYAMVADGARAALIGPRGDVVWMCAPRWHDDAIFSGLLGGPGTFAVSPTASRYVWGGQYEDGTLIWVSRWVTGTGIIECREALAYPGDPTRAVLLRRISAALGPASVRMIMDARANFGKHKMTRLSCHDGVWTARSGNLKVRLVGAPGAKTGDDGLEAVFDLAEGEYHDLVLEISDHQLPEEPAEPGPTWSATENAWHSVVPRFDNTISADDCRQSYAVLRGMTGVGGAMVAASTMGLPERAGQKRNYDYRYAWIRDQCYVGQAVAACKMFPLLDDAVGFVASRLLTDGPG